MTHFIIILVCTRGQATNKRKQPSRDSIIIGSSHASKKVQVQLVRSGKIK